MKYIFFSALVMAALASCNGNSSNSNGSPSDTSTTPIAGGDTSRAVPDSVNGGTGYMSSGNTASGNSNAGSLNTDTIPLGAGRNNTTDSIKARVLKQKGDTDSKSVKHHQ